MANSEAQFEQEINEARSARESQEESRVDIALWWDVKDKREAYRKNKHIPIDTIKTLNLEENMFSTLPTIFMSLADAGQYLFTEPLKIGRELFIEISLGAKDDPRKQVEPLFVKSKVESFNTKPNMTTGGCIYDIYLTLSATGFVNKVITYPEKSIAEPIGRPETSVEAIRNAAGLGGLPVQCDIQTYDSMHWINNSLTCKDFVDKIVNHSWIGEDDATIFYTSLDGNGHYTSIKTLTDNQQAINVITMSKYKEKCQKEGKDVTDNEWMKINGNIIAEKFELVNTGSRIQNVAGGIHQSVFYDNGWGSIAPAVLLAYSEKASAPDMQNIGFKERPNTRYVRFDGQSDMIYIGGQTNNDSQVARSVREKSFAGVHFDSTHLFYDFAESNNKAIKLGFFQQFWVFTVNTKKQLDYFFYDEEMIPKLGDVLYIDFDIENRENRLYTGRYLVTKIQHVWSSANDYSLVITVCSDGLHIENTKCKFSDVCPLKTCRYTKQFEKCDEYKKLQEILNYEKKREDDDEIEIAKGKRIKKSDPYDVNAKYQNSNSSKSLTKSMEKAKEQRRKSSLSNNKSQNTAEREKELKKQNDEIKRQLATQYDPWKVWDPNK